MARGPAWWGGGGGGIRRGREGARGQLSPTRPAVARGGIVRQRVAGARPQQHELHGRLYQQREHGHAAMRPLHLCGERRSMRSGLAQGLPSPLANARVASTRRVCGRGPRGACILWGRTAAVRRTSLSTDRAGLENVLIRGVSAISVPTFQQCSNNSLLFTCLRRVEGVPVGRARWQHAPPALAAEGG